MSYTIQVLPEATEEVAEIFAYYEARRSLAWAIASNRP
jgi:hypothetical protein